MIIIMKKEQMSIENNIYFGWYFHIPVYEMQTNVVKYIYGVLGCINLHYFYQYLFLNIFNEVLNINGSNKYLNTNKYKWYNKLNGTNK